MDLIKQDLGSEGSLVIKIVGGKLLIEISHDHKSGKISVLAEEDGSYFLDKLAEAIPGTFDDIVLGLAKEAIKKL